MKKTEENKCLLHNKNKGSQKLNDYDQKYNSDMLLVKSLWAILAGAAAIINLGEPFAYSDYLWNYTTISMATITVIYATMFNTPEKLRNASIDLKNNKNLSLLSLSAIISVVIAICIKRKFPLPIAVATFFVVTLSSLYFVRVLDIYFSGGCILCILKKKFSTLKSLKLKTSIRAGQSAVDADKE